MGAGAADAAEIKLWEVDKAEEGVNVDIKEGSRSGKASDEGDRMEENDSQLDGTFEGPGRGAGKTDKGGETEGEGLRFSCMGRLRAPMFMFIGSG